MLTCKSPPSATAAVNTREYEIPGLKIGVVYTDIHIKNRAQQLATELNLELVDPAVNHHCSALLIVTAHTLQLSLVNTKFAPIAVDFLNEAALYRHEYGGGRKQLLARAAGLHKTKNLSICDISAGLGRDAFVLAALGAQVTMIERSPIIAALLQDGWQRAQATNWIRRLNWQLLYLDSQIYLRSLTEDQRPQVIYFDPMFPERQKSALAKKEMRILREIVGEDTDAPQLLALALQTARQRVVVKRPSLASPLPGPIPSLTMKGQSSRFDIYLLNS